MRVKKIFLPALVTVIALTLAGCAILQKDDGRHARCDIIIRNGKIIDGAGNPWYYGDVAIKDARIAEIGDLSKRRAKTEIDAGSLIVSPGFIDVHTHADNGLLQIPDAENFIRRGVTTLVNGNCGGSPLDIGGHFKKILEKGTAVNFGQLIGHNSLLRKVKGNVADPLTEEQVEECKEILRKAMFDGAVGMSTGLEYTPGVFSTTDEIIELQKAVAELGGIYASHMRNEDVDIIPAIEEALKIGREAACRVEISHFKVAKDAIPGGAKTILKKVSDARNEGLEVWCDQYPYTASSTGIALLLPDWVFEKGREEAKRILEDPEQLKKVISAMKDYHEGKRHRKDFAYAVIASSRAYPEFVGKNIKEISQILKLRKEHGDLEIDKVKSLPDVTMEDQYRTIVDIHLKGGASCVYHSYAEEDLIAIMRSPFVSVCSDSGTLKPGRGKPHPRGYGSNPRVLGRYAREKKVLTFEEAVRKMTSMPARIFKMEDRGLVYKGFWADITIWNPDTIIDKATFEEPHQYSVGVEYVIVNGKIVLSQGELTGELPGMPVYGPAYEAE